MFFSDSHLHRYSPYRTIDLCPLLFPGRTHGHKHFLGRMGRRGSEAASNTTPTKDRCVCTRYCAAAPLVFTSTSSAALSSLSSIQNRRPCILPFVQVTVLRFFLVVLATDPSFRRPTSLRTGCIIHFHVRHCCWGACNAKVRFGTAFVDGLAGMRCSPSINAY